MPPPLIGGGIKRCFLSDVCLSDVFLTSVAYIGPKSRTERPWKTKIGTEVAHVTCDSDNMHFQGQKVTGQGHQAALLTAALTSEAGAAVTVRTYWAWETTATWRLLGGARGAGAPTAGGEGRGHIVSPRAQRRMAVERPPSRSRIVVVTTAYSWVWSEITHLQADTRTQSHVIHSVRSRQQLRRRRIFVIQLPASATANR